MHADFHTHTVFSADSETPVTAMIEKAIALGLKTICFTDHLDPDYPHDGPSFELDTEGYFQTLEPLQQKYRKRIEILIGVELGLQPHLGTFLKQYVKQYPFDFIIGSSHVAHGVDPYFAEYFEGRTERQAYQEYFESILENLIAFSDFQVYGHIDYVVRYGPNQDQDYGYEQYAEILDEVLKTLIAKNIGLELNTAGLKYGLQTPHPHPSVLKRYRQLGGDIVTVGSDGHKPEHLAYSFELVRDQLVDCGFTYYTEFRGRKAIYKKL